MKFTPKAAIAYLQKFQHEKDDGFRVVITEKQHDEIITALRKAGPSTRWVVLDLNDPELIPLFEQFGKADVAISPHVEFPDMPGDQDEWFISVFSRILGVTLCFPSPTQELFDSYVRRSPGLKPRNVLANPLQGSNPTGLGDLGQESNPTEKATSLIPIKGWTTA